MTVDNVFWYQESNLSPEQKQKCIDLRKELEQAGAMLPEATGLADDMTLLRFLKARHWHVHRAAKMYQVGATSISKLLRQHAEGSSTTHDRFAWHCCRLWLPGARSSGWIS